jgi:hypothetical protein
MRVYPLYFEDMMMGFPFLSPYLQSVASDFGHGANFAAAGATAHDIDSFIAPISLTVQINPTESKCKLSLLFSQALL